MGSKDDLIKRILTIKEFDRGSMIYDKGSLGNILRLYNDDGHFSIKIILQEDVYGNGLWDDIKWKDIVEGKIEDIHKIITDELYDRILEEMKILE